jgi:hypothetical protein
MEQRMDQEVPPLHVKSAYLSALKLRSTMAHREPSRSVRLLTRRASSSGMCTHPNCSAPMEKDMIG